MARTVNTYYNRVLKGAKTITNGLADLVGVETMNKGFTEVTFHSTYTKTVIPARVTLLIKGWTANVPFAESTALRVKLIGLDKKVVGLSEKIYPIEVYNTTDIGGSFYGISNRKKLVESKISVTP